MHVKKIFGQYLNKSSLIQALVILIFALIIAWPLLISKIFFQGNDVFTTISVFVYIKECIFKYHTFPQWNPFINTGLPIVGNPISVLYNPLVLVIYLLFPFVFATKTIYFLSIFLSGVFLNIFLRYFKIHKILSILTSAVYMCSGFMIARIVAGHVDWILCYPLIPLFYLTLLLTLKRRNLFWTGILSIIITLFIFTSTYVAFYSMIILVSTILFLNLKFFLNRKSGKIIVTQTLLLLASIVLTAFFAAVKILPMIEVFKVTSRNVDAFIGSQNIISFVYNFFIPSKRLFYFLGLSEYLKSSYFWWESFAFVGPLFLAGFFLCFIYWKRIRNENLSLMLFLFIVLLLFSFLDNPLSPFYWLFIMFPFLQTFRVPSRIYIFAIPTLLVCSIASINYLFIKYKHPVLKFSIIAFFIINLGITLGVFNIYFYTKSFPYLNPASDNLLNYLRNADKSIYYIAQSALFQNQLPVYLAIENHQKIFNQNTGWNIKNNPQSPYTQADIENKYIYQDIYPKYFIYPSPYIPPMSFKTKIIRENSGTKLYGNFLYTPYAYLTNNIQKIKLSSNDDINVKHISIGINKIDIVAYSPNDKQYLILTEDYFPSWRVNIDGKKNEFTNNRFLAVKAEKGLHLYSFTYFSKLFLSGLILSLFSIVLLLILVWKRKFLISQFKK